ncbi:hypothetical protein FB451DRAFT_1163976 [Mycena latifolia]|nr:hypothetical protein FB451DRAFT_1163976 [Mycena latifolia]
MARRTEPASERRELGVCERKQEGRRKEGMRRASNASTWLFETWDAGREVPLRYVAYTSCVLGVLIAARSPARKRAHREVFRGVELTVQRREGFEVLSYIFKRADGTREREGEGTDVVRPCPRPRRGAARAGGRARGKKKKHEAGSRRGPNGEEGGGRRGRKTGGDEMEGKKARGRAGGVPLRPRAGWARGARRRRPCAREPGGAARGGRRAGRARTRMSQRAPPLLCAARGARRWGPRGQDDAVQADGAHEWSARHERGRDVRTREGRTEETACGGEVCIAEEVICGKTVCERRETPAGEERARAQKSGGHCARSSGSADTRDEVPRVREVAVQEPAPYGADAPSKLKSGQGRGPHAQLKGCPLFTLQRDTIQTVWKQRQVKSTRLSAFPEKRAPHRCGAREKGHVVTGDMPQRRIDIDKRLKLSRIRWHIVDSTENGLVLNCFGVS